MAYSPAVLVDVPLVVPFIFILAPVKKLPFSPVTLPLTIIPLPSTSVVDKITTKLLFNIIV